MPNASVRAARLDKTHLKPWNALRIALCGALLLFAIASNIMEAVSVCLEPGRVGDIGAELHREVVDGKAQISIKNLRPDSPLTAIGIHNGDTVRLDHSWDDLRMFHAGEGVGVTRLSGGPATHYEIPVPAAAQKSLSDRIALNLNFLANFPLLLVSLFMLWRSKGDRGIVALGMAFACNAAASPYRWPTSAAEYPLWHIVLNAGFALIPWFLLRFSIEYYRKTTRPITAREERLYWGLVGLQITTFILYSLYTLQVLQLPIGKTLEVSHNFLQAAGFLISFWYLRMGLRAGDYETKKRYMLFLVALVGAFFPDIVFIVTAYVSNPFRLNSLSWLSLVSWVSQIAGSFLFAYAVFRHKVLDIGFAINRTLIYAAVSAILLTAFGLIEWAIEHVIHFEGREQSAFLDAGIAIGVFLTFHRVRDFVEHHIEAVFFRDWHLNQARLSQFVDEAPFVTRQRALYAALTSELTRFCGGASCAVYARNEDGHYGLAHEEFAEAPQVIDADRPVLVKLRAHHKPLELDGSAQLSGATIALPMMHRNDLQGFVLVTAKPSGDSYRPDEIELLGSSVQQIGLDLYALNMEALELEVAQLRNTNALLERNYAKFTAGVRAAFTGVKGSPRKVV